MDRIKIRGMEMHVTDQCNLHCISCSNYSNQHYGRHNSVAEADQWMRAWNTRLAPGIFTLLGGEPTLHPDLCRFVEVARTNWPGAELHVVTNGYFLHRHPDLPRVLRDCSPSVLVLSKHHTGPEYLADYNKFIHLLEDWRDQWGIKFELQMGIHQWIKRYTGTGPNMRPFRNGNAQRAWRTCKVKNNCINLLDSCLYKCPALAYLGRLNATHTLRAEWQPYLNYKPLQPGCTDSELQAWLRLEMIPECSMCPVRYYFFQPQEVPDPRR